MSVIQARQSLLSQLQEQEPEKVSFKFRETELGMFVFIKFGLTERIFKKKIVKKFKEDFNGHNVEIEDA